MGKATREGVDDGRVTGVGDRLDGFRSRVHCGSRIGAVRGRQNGGTEIAVRARNRVNLARKMGASTLAYKYFLVTFIVCIFPLVVAIALRAHERGHEFA